MQVGSIPNVQWMTDWFKGSVQSPIYRAHSPSLLLQGDQWFFYSWPQRLQASWVHRQLLESTWDIGPTEQSLYGRRRPLSRDTRRPASLISFSAFLFIFFFLLYSPFFWNGPIHHEMLLLPPDTSLYMNTYIRTIHTHIHTHIHTYYIHTYVHTYIDFILSESTYLYYYNYFTLQKA